MGQFGKLTSLEDLPADHELDALITKAAELASSAPAPRKPKHAPKPPPDRVSLTLDLLRAARATAILADGPHKAHPVAMALEHPDPHAPASLLADGPIELIIDRAAAQGLPAESRA